MMGLTGKKQANHVKLRKFLSGLTDYPAMCTFCFMFKESKIRKNLICIIAIFLVLTSCANHDDDGNVYMDFYENNQSKVDGANNHISYTYPENPAEALRYHLESDVKERGLPLDVGNIIYSEGDLNQLNEFMVSFTNNPDNMCIISFEKSNYLMIDEKDNPSFTISFKDPDNSQDMITVLTLVILYISPELSLDDAKEMAVRQDETISTDGYSMPQDIGGYQIQAQYTNPYVFFRTREFDSKMGIKVTALKQIWGEPYLQKAHELINPEDYHDLESGFIQKNGDNVQGKMVYADFIIKNVWHHADWVHGDTWLTVDVESITGQTYTLRVESMRMLVDYKFGVGQQYTLYIDTGSYYGSSIYYAIQRSVLNQYGSRGKPHPIDYPVNEDNRIRVEPEIDGTVYDVCFELQSQTIGEAYAALEGYRVGEKQWPHDPQRDGYRFTGWYNNLVGTGEPYTKDTPIYEDTTLYAQWQYIGSGGFWPRAYRGSVNINRDSFATNQKITIAAEGYNTHLITPNDQRFRWIPTGWKVSDKASGEFPVEAPFETTFSIDTHGVYVLNIVYEEEIFDGFTWQETGQVREVEELSFQVK